MGNKYLEFYGKNQISPVHTDITDWEKHVARRRKLYRQLGIPALAFKESEVLEIGPGGGYNTLPLLKNLGVKHVDMVEPNETGAKEIEKLFCEHGVEKDKYSIVSKMLEDFKTEKKYDIVIAEGFFQHIDNWKECLKSIKQFTKKDTILILTCADEIGVYVERMKRAVAQYMVREIREYDQKVDVLVEKMGGWLKFLPASTRPPRDWIEDQMMNEAFINEHLMSIKECMEQCKSEFDVWGTSQKIFTDYSWYKDLDYDYLKSYEEQYDRKKHMFLLADENSRVEYVRTVDENKQLEEAVGRASKAARELEKGLNEVEELVVAVEFVNQTTDNEDVKEFNNQLIEILKKLQDGHEVNWEQHQTFIKSFGKTQHYISLVKR